MDASEADLQVMLAAAGIEANPIDFVVPVRNRFGILDPIEGDIRSGCRFFVRATAADTSPARIRTSQRLAERMFPPFDGQCNNILGRSMKSFQPSSCRPPCACVASSMAMRLAFRNAPRKKWGTVFINAALLENTTSRSTASHEAKASFISRVCTREPFCVRFYDHRT